MQVKVLQKPHKTQNMTSLCQDTVLFPHTLDAQTFGRLWYLKVQIAGPRESQGEIG